MYANLTDHNTPQPMLHHLPDARRTTALRWQAAYNAAADLADEDGNYTTASYRAAAAAWAAAGKRYRKGPWGSTDAAFRQWIIRGLHDPANHPFIDEVAVKRATNFERAVIENLTPLEWVVYGVALNALPDPLGEVHREGGAGAVFGEEVLVDARRAAFTSLPAVLADRVRFTLEAARRRTYTPRKSRAAVAA